MEFLSFARDESRVLWKHIYYKHTLSNRKQFFLIFLEMCYKNIFFSVCLCFMANGVGKMGFANLTSRLHNVLYLSALYPDK